jgi:hypothetical protein
MRKALIFAVALSFGGNAHADVSCVDKLGGRSSDQELISCLKEIVGEIQSRSIPSGVIVASEYECAKLPGKWTNYTDAYGRVIVGAVPEGPFKPSEMEHEVKDYSEYYVKTRRGEENVILIEDNLPSHHHKLFSKAPNSTNGNDPTGENYIMQGAFPGGHDPWYILRAQDSPSTLGKSSDVGKNQSHYNMPPYVALYYCRKD